MVVQQASQPSRVELPLLPPHPVKWMTKTSTRDSLWDLEYKVVAIATKAAVTFRMPCKVVFEVGICVNS